MLELEYEYRMRVLNRLESKVLKPEFTKSICDWCLEQINYIQINSKSKKQYGEFSVAVRWLCELGAALKSAGTCAEAVLYLRPELKEALDRKLKGIE